MVGIGGRGHVLGWAPAYPGRHSLIVSQPVSKGSCQDGLAVYVLVMDGTLSLPYSDEWTHVCSWIIWHFLSLICQIKLLPALSNIM